jgi:hypothetical protein
VGSDTFLDFIAQQSLSLRKIKLHSTGFIQEEDEDILGQMASTAEHLQQLDYRPDATADSSAIITRLSSSLLELKLLDDMNILDLGDVLELVQQRKELGGGRLRNIEVELDQEALDLGGNQATGAEIRVLCGEEGIRFSLGSLSHDA